MKRSHFPFSKIPILIIFLGLFVNQAFSEESFNKISFVKDSLENGLQVIYHIDRSAPVVATVIHYRVGSRNENPNKTGYAHFFEHLMFESTDDIPRASMDKFIEEAGGNLNAATSFDQTVFFIQVPANEIRLPLWIESQRMRKLHVDSIGVETQRRVVLEEIKQRTDNTPYGQLLKKMCELGFPGSSYSWPVLGSSKHIESATIADFQNFYNSFYQPNNATLVIAGDFELYDAKKYVREYFGIYPKGNVPDKQFMPVDSIKRPVRKEIIDDKAQLPAVFIGFRGPEITHPDYYPLQLLVDILSSGESSRIYQKLVNEEEEAVQAGMYNLLLEKAGGLVMYGIANSGNDIKEVERLLREEIKKLLRTGITDEELQKAKNITEAQFVAPKKNVLPKARELARYNSYFGDPGMINTELEEYLSVTKEDIMRVAKKYFSNDKTVTLVFLPKGYDK